MVCSRGTSGTFLLDAILKIAANMLSSFSRQVPRLLQRPLACTLRARCFAAEADGGPAVNLTFGAPNEVLFDFVNEG